MNNEPVAWAYLKDGKFFDAIHPDEHSKYEGMYTTPLYTHPVKELTDEEILKIFYNIETPRTVSHHKNAIEFARAILRKAQNG